MPQLSFVILASFLAILNAVRLDLSQEEQHLRLTLIKSQLQRAQRNLASALSDLQIAQGEHQEIIETIIRHSVL